MWMWVIYESYSRSEKNAETPSVVTAGGKMGGNSRQSWVRRRTYGIQTSSEWCISVSCGICRHRTGS
jgi:hypothetical protein